MERFGILPFGCVSESSVAVVVQQQPRRSNPKPANNRTRRREDDEDHEESLSMKPDISTGFHKLFKGFKTFSQLLVYREEMEEDMEIGFPTDVKHVSHVGLDESACSIPSRSVGSWDNLFSPPHRFTFPSPQRDLIETQASVQAST